MPTRRVTFDPEGPLWDMLNGKRHPKSWPRLFGQRPAGFKWIPAGLC
ncbi:hypothetical protein ACVIU7_002871 [Bradyrhizobium liaoningense]